MKLEEEIKNTSARIVKMRAENEVLQQRIMKYQTIVRIEKIAAYLGFTETSRPLSIKDDTIALR